MLDRNNFLHWEIFEEDLQSKNSLLISLFNYLSPHHVITLYQIIQF